MSRMSLDTAIRLSAEVKGGGNITKVQREIQSLAASSKLTGREINTLRTTTLRLAQSNTNTLAGIRSTIGAFRGLQEQAKIGSREFQRYGAEVQKLEAKLRGLDGTAEKVGASLGQKLAAGLAAAGIGRALQGITQQAASFDAEVRKAAAIEGGAGSFEVLRKEIEAVASVAAGTPTEVAALATALSRAGFTADQTQKALRGIVLGAEATDTAFDQMGSIVGTVLKTFQMDASQTSGVVDVMVKSANSANQTVTDVGEAMSYAAGEANTLGVSVEDTAAVIALLADAGVRGSRGGTTFATGLNRLQIAAGGADSEMQELIKGSAKMADAMGRLGAEVLDAEGKLKPIDQVLIAIKRQMQGMSATDQAIISKALFGAEAGRGFQAVLARTEEEITKMFRGINDAGGTAEETREKMRGFGDSLTILGGNVQSVTNQIGGMIGAALKPLVDGLNAALGAAAKLPEPVKQFGAFAAAAGLSVAGLAAAMVVLNGTLAVFGGASGIKAAIGGLLSFNTAAALATKAAVALNLAVLGPWALLVAGLAAATAAAYKFNEPFKQFVDTYPGRFETFWKSIAADAEASFKRIEKAFDQVVGFMRLGVERMVADQRELQAENNRTAQLLTEGMKLAADSIGINFSGVFDFIQDKWRMVVANMINFANPLTTLLTGLGINLGQAATAALDYQPPPPAPTSWQESMFGGRGRNAVPPPAPVLPPPGGGDTYRVGDTVTGDGGSRGSGKTKEEREKATLTSLASGAGFSPQNARIMAAIALAESAGNPMAHNNKYPDNSYGLWQINMLGQMGPERRRQFGIQSNEQLFDPAINARAAKSVFDEQGFGAWSVYKSGAYQQFLGKDAEIEGVDAKQIASAQAQAADQLKERQQSLIDLIDKGNQSLDERSRETSRQVELSNAVNDEERRTLQYYFQQQDIKSTFNKLRDEALDKHKQAIELGVEFNLQERLGLIASQEKLELQFAESEAAKELLDIRIRENDLMAERVRMMQGITQQAAESPAFQTQGMKIEDQIGKLKEDLAEMTSIATLAGRSAEGIGNAFGNAFQELISGAASARQVLSNFFLDVAKNFAQMAAEIIAKQMQMVVLQTILKALGAVAGAAGGGADFAPSDTGPFGGAGLSTALSFDPSNLVPRALGGSTATGRPYKVGENGPELFVPYQAGTIIPAEATEALEAINNASLRGLQVPFQATAATASGKASQQGSSSSSSGLSVPFQRGMEGLSVPFQRGGMDGSVAAGGGGGAGVIDVKFETVRIGELDFVTKDEAQRIGRESAKQGAALAQKRITNNPSTRRQAGIG
jgi:TP901 family phage tail tape measure protein